MSIHRELKLIENGITISTYHSEHSDKYDTLGEDMKKFLSKIQAKQTGNCGKDFNWKIEITKEFNKSPVAKFIKSVSAEEEFNNSPMSKIIAKVD